MKTLHIVPGESAAASLREALRVAGRDDGLLVFRDDLSCGPILSLDPTERADWWNEPIDWPEIEENLRLFWANLDIADGRLIVWFGRLSARELAFRMALAWRMKACRYHVIDVSKLSVAVQLGNGGNRVIEAAQAVSIVPSTGLATLFDSEKAASVEEDAVYRRDWTKLMAENAPFRVVTSSGLASAPSYHFDRLLLAQASSSWKKIAYIVAKALEASQQPYLQVSDVTLHERVITLIEKGELVAEGDPGNMRRCEVRLPGK